MPEKVYADQHHRENKAKKQKYILLEAHSAVKTQG